MKVLIVYPQFWIDGGAEKVVIRLCNYLTEHNIDNTILTTKMIPEIKSQLTETRIIEMGTLENVQSMLHSISEDFDVINVHNEPCQLLVYPKNMNAIWSFNELPAKIQLGGVLPEKEIKMVQNFIKKIIVADERNREKVKTVYNKDSIIIPYGIDYDFFQEASREDMRNRFLIDKDDFVITQVGFIAPTKNQVESVKILAEVKKKIPNAKLVLAGPILEDYKKLVDEEIMKNNLYTDVIFTGKLNQGEIRDLLKESDVALQPNKGQGSWLSVFEAISCAVPVVVSSEFTGKDLLIESHNWIFDTIDEAVENIYNIHDFPSDNFKEWEFVKTELTWNNYCKKVVEVFYESLAR